MTSIFLFIRGEEHGRYDKIERKRGGTLINYEREGKKREKRSSSVR